MPINLLALCGDPGDPSVKRVRTSAEVQNRLDGFFETLEMGFRDGVERERPYDSRWTPEADEIIILPINDEVNEIQDRIGGGVLALEEVDGAAFENERIRALAALRGDAVGNALLLQSFSLSQRLARKMAFISHNNTFNKIDTSAFTLSNHLDIIVEGGLVKFKNYNVAKRIFDLSSHYREATDEEIKSFAQSAVLAADADHLINLATQPLRKLIAVYPLDPPIGHPLGVTYKGIFMWNVKRTAGGSEHGWYGKAHALRLMLDSSSGGHYRSRDEPARIKTS